MIQLAVAATDPETKELSSASFSLGVLRLLHGLLAQPKNSVNSEFCPRDFCLHRDVSALASLHCAALHKVKGAWSLHKRQPREVFVYMFS